MGDTYRGVPVPPEINPETDQSDTDRTLERAIERDKDVRTLKLSGADRPFVDAFLAILADNPDGARQAIKDMSGRDRAVLSFMLTELSSVVDDAEMYRRTGQTG